MNELLIASLGVAGFAATSVIGYVFLKRHTVNGEHFSRLQAEDAMKIKAKQYEEPESYY